MEMSQADALRIASEPCSTPAALSALNTDQVP
jgi:hypothetical protein